jgi:hypothetical protein
LRRLNPFPMSGQVMWMLWNVMWWSKSGIEVRWNDCCENETCRERWRRED